MGFLWNFGPWNIYGDSYLWNIYDIMIWLVVDIQPLWKRLEFVNWDDDIPNICENNPFMFQSPPTRTPLFRTYFLIHTLHIHLLTWRVSPNTTTEKNLLPYVLLTMFCSHDAIKYDALFAIHTTLWHLDPKFSPPISGINHPKTQAGTAWSSWYVSACPSCWRNPDRHGWHNKTVMRRSEPHTTQLYILYNYATTWVWWRSSAILIYFVLAMVHICVI